MGKTPSQNSKDAANGHQRYFRQRYRTIRRNWRESAHPWTGLALAASAARNARASKAE